MKSLDYSLFAKYYDIFEETDENLNKIIAGILIKNNLKSILDFSCGTGAQAIYLKNIGFDIVGCDIDSHMIEIAKSKALEINFIEGDMRSSELGQFDAIISVYNSVGHLSRKDFESAVGNIGKNLKKGGLFVFDIFNLAYTKKNIISNSRASVSKTVNGIKYERFNNNFFNEKEGKLRYNQKNYIYESHASKPLIMKLSRDLQLYERKDLEKILTENNFEILNFLDISGGKFIENASYSILTVARKT